jgi:hypothetical protein
VAASDNKNNGFGLPPGLAASAALVVAVFAAVGVAGDLLTRAVRNEPGPMAWVVGLALWAVGIPIIVIAKNWATRVAVFLLLIVLTIAVIVGTNSVSDREQPRVALSAMTEDDTVTVSVEAGGSSLRTTDDMLVQVIGLRIFSDFDGMVPECESSRLRDIPSSSEVGDLLVWDRAGPNGSGDVELSIEFEIPVGEYGGLCAWTALPDKDRDNPSDDRATAAYLRLPTE